MSRSFERQRLLGDGDVAPVGIERADGRSSFVLVCDHAGNALPGKLRGLGLSEEHLIRHIAWDLGVLALCRRLSERLDAPLIYQCYSRLVIDCNRPPGSLGSIMSSSDGTHIPGNAHLSESETAARVDEIFTPYHAAIGALLECRLQAKRETILLSMHSFTPRLETFHDVRPWQIGVLFNRCTDFPLALVEALKQGGDLTVGVNEPYAVEDASDYAIPVHGEQRGLRNALLEVRQDLIDTEQRQSEWAARLEQALLRAARQGS